MGLEEVKQEILNHGEKQANSITKEGETEAQKIHAEALKKVEDYKVKSAEHTQNLVATMEKRELARASFDVRKKLLDKKKEIIDEVIDGVKEDIKKLPVAKQEQYIKNLIAKAKQEIDVKFVYANAKDKSKVNKVKSVVFKPKPILGGIIAETSDTKISVDYSYEQLLETIREKHLQEIGSMLFR